MVDRITRSFLDDFLDSQELKSKNDSKDFEKFVNYSVVSKEFKSSFQLQVVSTGSSAIGIDGMAILVNGKLVESEDEIDDLVNLNKFLEAQIIIIQSKTENSFNGSLIGNFFFTIKQLFSESPTVVLNEELTLYKKIIDKIYDHSPRMTKGKPVLTLYYVTLGKWIGDTNLEAVVKSGKEELMETNFFSKIEFNSLGASEIQKLYTKTREIVTTTFTFKDKVTLPDIKNVKESYYGMLPFEEFRKLVIDENDKIRSIFYDNVRDYLGDNPVNEKIESTLNKGDYDIFSILNNGITIVASDLNSAGNRYTIADYQIVNGCQTSHVLYNFRNANNINNLVIPLKLIVTDNEDVKNQITIATNSQTEVKPEQLEALSDFQKTLEFYYKSIASDGKLFYERRTNQYSSDNEIAKTRIVSIPNQIKSFSSMFLNNPHVVSGYYGTIARDLGAQIFKRDHYPISYYASSYALYRLESLFRSGNVDSKYKKVKYQMIMMFRFVFGGLDMPELNNKKIIPYCEKMITILDSNEESARAYTEIAKLIDEANLDMDNRKQFKDSQTTQDLIELLKNQ